MTSKTTPRPPYRSQGFCLTGSSSSSKRCGLLDRTSGATGRYAVGGVLTGAFGAAGAGLAVTGGGAEGGGAGAAGCGITLATGRTGFKALLICASVQRRPKELRIISANGAGMRLICASVALSALRCVNA